MLDKKGKASIIAKFRTHANDTGSPQVQIAILSAEIDHLTKHLQQHKQDHSSRRGLLKKVGERRKLLKYLQKEDDQAFFELAKKLKLKIAKKMQEEEEEKKKLEEEIMKDDEDTDEEGDKSEKEEDKKNEE